MPIEACGSTWRKPRGDWQKKNVSVSLKRALTTICSVRVSENLVSGPFLEQPVGTCHDRLPSEVTERSRRSLQGGLDSLKAR